MREQQSATMTNGSDNCLLMVEMPFSASFYYIVRIKNRNVRHTSLFRLVVVDKLTATVIMPQHLKCWFTQSGTSS
jgi:hypothetical protein